MTALDPPLLAVQKVAKTYRTREHEFLAISGVDLEIREGEFVCLLGPSGCGKSTLLRIVAGLQRQTAGEVLYRGAPLQGVNPHATIVFQTFALYPWLSVLDNVALPLRARGVAEAARKERALALIHTVGLDGFESAYPRELSGGMRQKVGFARAMASEPELLCLDEPFSALDVLSAESLRGELLELWLGRAIPTKAILMVTHNIEEAVLLGSRIVVMGKDPGHVIASLDIRLKQPRARTDTAFQSIVDKVYALVAGDNLAAAEAKAAARVPMARRLPSGRPNALAGLAERLAQAGGRMDLSRLCTELSLQLDELLPLVEGAEMLGLAKVEQDDLQLSPLGRTFADASIPARKEIVAARMLRHPTLSWIHDTLQCDDNGRVDVGFFLDRLRPTLGDAAQTQIDDAIRWGRYAELFAYDDDSRELYLEQG
jgi:NitT/TauT family transport system ATP-binding protein